MYWAWIIMLTELLTCRRGAQVNGLRNKTQFFKKFTVANLKTDCYWQVKRNRLQLTWWCGCWGTRCWASGAASGRWAHRGGSSSAVPAPRPACNGSRHWLLRSTSDLWFTKSTFVYTCSNVSGTINFNSILLKFYWIIVFFLFKMQITGKFDELVNEIQRIFRNFFGMMKLIFRVLVEEDGTA